MHQSRHLESGLSCKRVLDCTIIPFTLPLKYIHSISPEAKLASAVLHVKAGNVTPELGAWSACLCAEAFST